MRSPICLCVCMCDFCSQQLRYMNAYPNIVGVSKNGIVRYQDLLEVLPTCSISESVRGWWARNCAG